MEFHIIGKAKIERWFRTLKDRWMAGLHYDEFKTLDELRESFMEYVQEYNTTVHSSLDEMSPTDRFFSESSQITRLTDQQIEKAFLLEIERTVSADSVVKIDNTPYEVDSRYANRRLTIRYSSDLEEVYVYDKDTGEYEKMQLLDKHSNAKVKRKVRMAGNE